MNALENVSNTDLKNEAKDLYNLINIAECFSARDVTRYGAICKELEARGYKLSEHKTLFINKE